MIKNNFFKLQRKNYQGFYFTRQENTQDIIQEKGIKVYEGPEWNELNNFLIKKNYYDLTGKDKKEVKRMYDIWEDYVMESSFKAKYFALIPFFLDDRNSTRAKKKFVLSMELYPEKKYLKFVQAMATGIQTTYEPLLDIIPLPSEDYKIRHLVLRSRPPHFIDMEMIYANRKVINMYCFDQKGTWHDDGVQHPAFKLENSYKENNWFDHVNWENQWL